MRADRNYDFFIEENEKEATLKDDSNLGEINEEWRQPTTEKKIPIG